MPIISMFFGIVIKMHYRDHNPPHFHAEYQGFEALFEITTGEIIDGEFPKSARNLIRNWAKENRDELMAKWHRARGKEPLLMVPGADQ